MNDHPLAVDVADLEVRHFCATCARGIKRHQQDAMKGKLCRVDQTCDFFLAQHLWQTRYLLRIRCLGNTPASLQHLNVEEAQGSKPQDYGGRAELQLSEERRLILANVLGTAEPDDDVLVVVVVLDLFCSCRTL